MAPEQLEPIYHHWEERLFSDRSHLNNPKIPESVCKIRGKETIYAYQSKFFIAERAHKVVEMMENGDVETLIVKDLSRLGRGYLQVGCYTEIYFPQKCSCTIK